MAQLLQYHRREENPVWWAYFNRHGHVTRGLVEDTEAIGEFTLDPATAIAYDSARSSTRSVPRAGAQAHARAKSTTPATERGVNVVEIDDDAQASCASDARRTGPTSLYPPALMPGGPYRHDRAARRAAPTRRGSRHHRRRSPGRVPRAARPPRPPPTANKRPPSGSPSTGFAGDRPAQGPFPSARQLVPIHPGATRAPARPGPARSSSSHLIDQGRRVGGRQQPQAIHILLHEVESRRT